MDISTYCIMDKELSTYFIWMSFLRYPHTAVFGNPPPRQPAPGALSPAVHSGWQRKTPRRKRGVLRDISISFLNKKQMDESTQSTLKISLAPKRSGKFKSPNLNFQLSRRQTWAAVTIINHFFVLSASQLDMAFGHASSSKSFAHTLAGFADVLNPSRLVPTNRASESISHHLDHFFTLKTERH